jgi:hypothetical protein
MVYLYERDEVLKGDGGVSRKLALKFPPSMAIPGTHTIILVGELDVHFLHCIQNIFEGALDIAEYDGTPFILFLS